MIGNESWGNAAGDLVTIHDYNWDPAVLGRRYANEDAFATTLSSYFPGSRRVMVGEFNPSGKPVMVTEFGGVSYAPDAGETWSRYGTDWSPEEYIDRYRLLNESLQESSLQCGFC